MPSSTPNSPHFAKILAKSVKMLYPQHTTIATQSHGRWSSTVGVPKPPGRIWAMVVSRKMSVADLQGWRQRQIYADKKVSGQGQLPRRVLQTFRPWHAVQTCGPAK